MSYKCQQCSGVHNKPGECSSPTFVLKSVSYRGAKFFVAPDDSYLQVRQIIDGKEQHGRKWRLSVHMVRSEIVQTAFMAALAFEEHECRERFQYKGQAIFGPHYNVDALLRMCEQGQLDFREVAD